MRKNDKMAAKKNEAKKRNGAKREAQHGEDARLISQNAIASIDSALALLRERAAAFGGLDFNLYSLYGIAQTQNLVGWLQWFREAAAYVKDIDCEKTYSLNLNKRKILFENIVINIKHLLNVQEPVLKLANDVGCGIAVDDEEMKMDLAFFVWERFEFSIKKALIVLLDGIYCVDPWDDPSFADRIDRLDDEAHKVVYDFINKNKNKSSVVEDKIEYEFTASSRIYEAQYNEILRKKELAILAEYGHYA